jgi:hypothetical protein
MRLREGGDLRAGFGYTSIEGLKNSPLGTYCTMYIHLHKCNLHFLHLWSDCVLGKTSAIDPLIKTNPPSTCVLHSSAKVKGSR